jgi:hypothetical protein
VRARNDRDSQPGSPGFGIRLQPLTRPRAAAEAEDQKPHEWGWENNIDVHPRDPA